MRTNKVTKTTKIEHLHADGSLWGRGQLKGKHMHGKWVWFRKGGSKMREGTFAEGKQVGKWTTYDKNGRVVKVTDFSKKVDKAIKNSTIQAI